MKYYVKALEVHAVVIEVEADDEDDARQAAEECMESGFGQDGEELPSAAYEYTQDCEDWPVWT